MKEVCSIIGKLSKQMMKFVVSYKSEERSDRKSGILGYETAPWLTLATLSGKLCGSSG
jgi:hypothetical protein